MRLREATAALGAMYGTLAAPALGAFELILLENSSYLVDDARRMRVFEALCERAGITPRAILDCAPGKLADVISEGGMKPEMRAEKLRQCARLAQEAGGVAAIEKAVRRGDVAAKRLLQRFPGIGEPAADRILLVCAGVPSVAPDSNALRVLARLGFIEESRNYAQTYRAAIEATRDEIASADEARTAHLLLRRHGQEVCKRTSPRCELCPLRPSCAWYASGKELLH